MNAAYVTSPILGSSTTTRKFPTAYLYLAKYYEKTWEQRQFRFAQSGIRRAEHRIGYDTERMESHVAENRFDDIQLCKNSIASHHRRRVKHRKTLASLAVQA